jgi:hypothetical protein
LSGCSDERVLQCAEDGGSDVLRQVRVVNVAIEVLHETGIEDCSLELVADVASIDLDQLLVLFRTRPDLVRAMFERWAGALSGPLLPIAAELGTVAYSGFKVDVPDALEDDVRSDREPSTMDAERGAQQLLALFDGLRVQALLEPGSTSSTRPTAPPHEYDAAGPSRTNSTTRSSSCPRAHARERRRNDRAGGRRGLEPSPHAFPVMMLAARSAIA